jgi:hypothetical protein
LSELRHFWFWRDWRWREGGRTLSFCPRLYDGGEIGIVLRHLPTSYGGSFLNDRFALGRTRYYVLWSTSCRSGSLLLLPPGAQATEDGAKDIKSIVLGVSNDGGLAGVIGDGDIDWWYGRVS